MPTRNARPSSSICNHFTDQATRYDRLVVVATIQSVHEGLALMIGRATTQGTLVGVCGGDNG